MVASRPARRMRKRFRQGSHNGVPSCLFPATPPATPSRQSDFAKCRSIRPTNRAVAQLQAKALAWKKLSGFFAVTAVSDTFLTLRLRVMTQERRAHFVTRKIDSASQERSQWRAELMARVQDGDRDSCRVLLDDIGPMLTNFLRRRIADRDELEDVYQETLMALFEARHTYQPSRPLEPWLFAIARNIAADHARRYWTRISVEQLTDEPREVAADEEPRSDLSLERAVARLPNQQREAFSMLKLEGLSIEQAAGRAGITVGALRVRAHRAYKALRKMISE